MKFTTKLIIFWASVFLIFFLGIIFVMSVFWGIQFNFWHLLVAFIINGIIPPAVITAFFYKRLDFMESESFEQPNFKGTKTAELTFTPRTKHPFDELMQKIDRQYIVSFSDRDKKIVKFRTDSRMLSWGIGGCVRMISPEKVSVFLFPVFENSRREELILNQTLRILDSIFRAC